MSPRSFTRLRRGGVITGAAVVVALLVSACSSGGGVPSSSPTQPGAITATPLPAGSTDFDPKLIADAKAAASEITGGKQLGGKVTFIGSTGGYEGQILQALFKPFTEATGVQVDYQGTSNVDAIVQTQLRAGNPPDFVQQNSIGGMFGYAKQGALKPLNKILDMKELEKDYPKSMLDGLSYKGNLYGAPAAANTMEVWYNPTTYKGPKDATFDQLMTWADKEVKAGSTAPFCMDLNQGANSATIAIYFIENIFLKQYGPDEFQKWTDGKLKYTSKEVKTVYKEVLDLFTKNYVYGGAQGALTTPIIQSPVGLFTTPQQCQVLHWGSFTPGVISTGVPTAKPGANFTYFNLANAKSSFGNTTYAAPWTSYAFTDTPQLKAFVKYYTSTAFQILTASTGHWIMSNKNIPDTIYSNVVQQGLATDFKNAGTVEFGPFLNASGATYQHQKDAFMELVANPGGLDSFLQGMDDARASG